MRFLYSLVIVLLCLPFFQTAAQAGKYNPTLNLCLRIARALDKTLDDLFWKEVDDG